MNGCYSQYITVYSIRCIIVYLCLNLDDESALASLLYLRGLASLSHKTFFDKWIGVFLIDSIFECCCLVADILQIMKTRDPVLFATLGTSSLAPSEFCVSLFSKEFGHCVWRSPWWCLTLLI